MNRHFAARRAHCDADVARRERRGVIHAVANDRDVVTLGFHRANELNLVLWQTIALRFFTTNLGGNVAPDEDTLVCGDDADAKAIVLELAGKVTSGRAIDAGPLASARALEGMTAVIVNVNKRYKAHAGLRMTGV